MLPQNIKAAFKQFVFAYIASTHTQTDESEQELKMLINEFVVNFMYEEDCFTYPALCDAIAYVEQNISDENKGFYHYWVNKLNYREKLEEFIKFVISDNAQNKNDSDEFVDNDSDGLN